MKQLVNVVQNIPIDKCHLTNVKFDIGKIDINKQSVSRKPTAFHIRPMTVHASTAFYLG